MSVGLTYSTLFGHVTYWLAAGQMPNVWPSFDWSSMFRYFNRTAILPFLEQKLKLNIEIICVNGWLDAWLLNYWSCFKEHRKCGLESNRTCRTHNCYYFFGQPSRDLMIYRLRFINQLWCMPWSSVTWLPSSKGCILVVLFMRANGAT